MFLIDITIRFDQACAEILKNDPELLAFSRTHQIRPVTLNNLCREIVKYEKAFKNKAHVIQRDAIIFEVAKMYTTAIKNKRDQDNWSSAKRAQEINKDSLKNDVRQLIREVTPHGTKAITD